MANRVPGMKRARKARPANPYHATKSYLKLEPTPLPSGALKPGEKWIALDENVSEDIRTEASRIAREMGEANLDPTIFVQTISGGYEIRSLQRGGGSRQITITAP